MEQRRWGPYVCVKLIGSGGEGQVFLVQKEGNPENYVLKQRVCSDFDEANNGLREVTADPDPYNTPTHAIALQCYSSAHMRGNCSFFLFSGDVSCLFG